MACRPSTSLFTTSTRPAWLPTRKPCSTPAIRTTLSCGSREFARLPMPPARRCRPRSIPSKPRPPADSSESYWPARQQGKFPCRRTTSPRLLTHPIEVGCGIFRQRYLLSIVWESPKEHLGRSRTGSMMNHFNYLVGRARELTTPSPIAYDPPRLRSDADRQPFSRFAL